MHAGFWTCLFYGDAEGGTLYSRLVEALNSVQDTSKPIYLTGLPLPNVLATTHALWSVSWRVHFEEPASMQAPCGHCAM